MIDFCLPLPQQAAISVKGMDALFPIHRIYCVGRNYGKHIVEMGGTIGNSEPVFFTKPPSAAIDCTKGKQVIVPYPLASSDVHHEVELVLCLGMGGVNIPAATAKDHIFGYSVGVDLTRRDLQQKAKEQRGPWDVAKGFAGSAPLSSITRKEDVQLAADAAIRLSVNDEVRQNGNLSDMIWSPDEIIASLSRYFELRAGDVIFTGTPEGVGPLMLGDRVEASIEGLQRLAFNIE